MPPIISLALERAERFRKNLPDLPVHHATTPDAIRSHLDERYDFQQPMDARELVEGVASVLERWAVHVVHPRYFGYFNPTPLDEAVAADLLTAIYNPQLAVWSHAPAAVEMEQHVLRWVSARLGLPAETSGAHFTSGGSEADFTAVVAALTRVLPDYGRGGWPKRRYGQQDGDTARRAWELPGEGSLGRCDRDETGWDRACRT